MSTGVHLPLFESLCDELHAQLAAARTMHARLLLDSWADNAVASMLEDQHPALSAERLAVPDEHFVHREDEAPCLVPVPRALLNPGSRQFLAELLAQAWRHALQRQARQPLCAVVLGHADAASIARHWSDLGHQRPPDAMPARLFRYQDPRVMQRVWPLLHPSQRTLWLGPVEQWWSLSQPWGPWDPAQYTSDGEIRRADPPPRWFRATAPQRDTANFDGAHIGKTCALLDRSQWDAAHATPYGHRTWARLARQRVPVEDQPDGDTMLRLLTDGRQHGLDGSDLEEYVICTWQTTPLADGSRELRWQSPRGERVLKQVLATLRQQPGASFIGLFSDTLNRRT